MSYDPQRLGARCGECPLQGGIPVPPTPPASGKVKLIIVGEAPGKQEEIAMRPFVGPSGRLLDDVMREAGLNRDDAWVTNAFLCRTDDDALKPKATACCAKRLANEVKRVATPKTPIVALGKWSSVSILGQKQIQKIRGFLWAAPDIDGKKIVALRRAAGKTRLEKRKERYNDNAFILEARQAYEGMTVFPTVHPAFILRGADGWRPPLRRDIRRVARWLEGGGRLSPADEGSYVIARTASQLKKALAKLGDAVTDSYVGTDIETDGTDPTRCAIDCVGVSDGVHTVVAFPWRQSMAKPLTQALRRRIAVTHNGPAFDEICLAAHGVTVNKTADTLIGHHTYAAHLPQRLDHVASMFVDAKAWKILAKSTGGDSSIVEKGFAPSKKIRDCDACGKCDACLNLVSYNAADARIQVLSWRGMQADLKSEMRVYEDDMRLAKMCQRMQVKGLLVDVAKRDALARMLRRRVGECLSEMHRMVGRESFSPNKPAEVRKALFGTFHAPIIKITEKGYRSTAGDVLETLQALETRGGKLAGLIIDYREAQKLCSTFVEGISIGPDGRVHASWRSFGTTCMPAGELVLTNRGYLPVEQVQIGDEVITHLGRPRAVTATGRQRSAPMYRVTLTNGLSLVTTGNHPYLVEGEWVRADRLVPGDVATVHSEPEEWREVSGWPYQVSSWGRVRSVKGVIKLTVKRQGGTRTDYGHLKVMMSRNGSQVRGEDRKDFAVHRLVIDAFGSPRPGREDVEVRHLNGIPWDNTIGNLAWGTAQQNRDDAKRHGTMSKRNHRQAKLALEQVEEIRSAPAPTRRGDVYNSDLAFAVKFNVTRELVRDVRRGLRWMPETFIERKRAKFSSVEVASIERLRDEASYMLTIEEDHSHVTGGIVTHNSGRLAARRPNLQNLPRNPEVDIRSMYIPAPGCVFIYFDLGQAEARLAAYASQDSKYMAAIESGDPYLAIAKVLFPFALHIFEADAKSLSEREVAVRKALRQISKKTMLAAQYWVASFNLLPKLLADPDIRGMKIGDKTATEFLTLERVDGACDIIHRTYREYFKWVDDNYADIRKAGHFRDEVGGRIRWLGYYPKITDVANSRIQQGIASIMNDRLPKLEEKTLRLKPVRISRNVSAGVDLVAQVHDSATFEVPEKRVERVKMLIRETWKAPIVLRNGRSFVMPIDLKVGTSWSDKDMKKA